MRVGKRSADDGTTRPPEYYALPTNRQMQPLAYQITPAPTSSRLQKTSVRAARFGWKHPTTSPQNTNQHNPKPYKPICGPRTRSPHREAHQPPRFRYRCPAYGMLGIAPVRNRCTRVTANLAPRGVHRDLFVGVGHRADSADHHRPQGQPRHHRGLGRLACFSWCSLGRLRHGPSGTDPHRPRERLRVSARWSGHHS